VQQKRYFFLIFFLFFISTNLFSSIKHFLKSVNVLRVNSVKQYVVDFNTVILEGEVEVWVDNKIHIWADKVVIDKEERLLLAERKSLSPVVVEDNNFFILMDRFSLNLQEKSGWADNVRIHVAEGYVSVQKAEKLKEGGKVYWKMNDMSYTSCDNDCPHWVIKANSAKLCSNYLLSASGVLFKVGPVPAFFLPKIILPVQNRFKSGFLLPRFSFDEELGLGVREEFYWMLAPRCDNTFGVDWKEKKGTAFLNEFRWVRSPESFTLFNAYYAFEKMLSSKKMI